MTLTTLCAPCIMLRTLGGNPALVPNSTSSNATPIYFSVKGFIMNLLPQSNCHWKHPKQNNGREVKWADACTHTQWLPNAACINVCWDIFQILPFVELPSHILAVPLPASLAKPKGLQSHSHLDSNWCKSSQQIHLQHSRFISNKSKSNAVTIWVPERNWD